MAKQRLFPEPQRSDRDQLGTRKNFERISTNVFSVPKDEIDKREREWEQSRTKPKPA